MKTKIFKMFLFAGLLTAAGCETFDLDQTINPSTISQDQNDPVYAFNYVQLQLPEFVNSANSFTQRVTRQMAMTGGNTYNNAFAPVNFDTNWTQAYLILNAIKTAEARATDNGQFFIRGANQVIRCYILMTLVDMYGNIPYSEALQGNENLTPKFDNGADIYASVYEELNQAINLLETTEVNLPTALVARDLYYGSGERSAPDPAAWIRVAKTLKFKMLNTARLVNTLGTHNIQSEMQALVTGDQLITKEEQDFAFKYGNIRVNPNSRHPLYNDQYELGGGGTYLGNYMMWAVSREKQNPTGAYNTAAPYLDPRTKFYFFNQSNTASGTTQELPCNDLNRRPPHYENSQYYSFYRPKEGSGAIPPAYCTTHLSSTGNALWGRDHGDNSGIPLDVNKRTVVGLYPAGGAYGNPTAVAETGSIAGTKGALGEGIMPILMSSFTHFMLAEAKLTGLISGGDAGAKTSFMEGITNSIDRVIKPVNGYPALDSGTLAAIGTSRTNYLNFMSGAWDTYTANRLELIIKEFYIASWGNGIEPYNNYRRTGFPSNFQPTLELDAGTFFYTALYPGVSINNNPNAPSNNRSRRTFWDVAGITLF